MNRTLITKTTFLEMLSPDLLPAPAPPADIELLRLVAPELAKYRLMYNSVGRDYHWVDRIRMSDDDLRRIIHDDRVEIYLLKVAQLPAGYTELDCRVSGQIEIAYFGLFPQFIGKGLGKYLLWWTLDRAWSYKPRRVWVHTCDLDHKAALPNYLKAGFSIFDERTVEQIVADA